MTFKTNLCLLATAIAMLAAIAELRSAFAEAPEEKGLRLAVEADQDDVGFGDSAAQMIMVLRNKQGETSERHFRNGTLEVQGDGDKSIAIFDRPPDIDGTALLTFTHKTGSDDQWLYLPALKRVKRISSSNKSGSFVGSEFAYEDLSSQEVEKYTYKWLAEEACPGAAELACNVIERYPTDEDSGYLRQILWMDQAEYRVHKIDFYDRKDSLLKTLILSDYHEYLGRHWRPHKLSMVNHQTGKNTDLDVLEMTFKQGLSDRDFDQKALERAR